MTDFETPDAYWRWHDAHGYSRIINVSGTMTGLGASIVRAPVRDATTAAMGRFVSIHQMQANASQVIARLTGSEAGCLTASASAAITLCVAACLTGTDPGRAEALPCDPGEQCEVVVQAGHLCGYGAPVATSIALAGAQVRSVGQSTLSMDHQLEATLSHKTAAAVYVVSHHVVHYGQIPFKRFVEICHGRHVPVIVDAASEYDVRSFIDQGADLVIYSVHKFMGGPTAGIIAGTKQYVRASYLQNVGIGRGFKIGKESIAGAIEAMEQWMVRDHASVRAIESATLDLWCSAFESIPGIVARRVPDPTANPLERLQIAVNEAIAGCSAATYARVLSEQDPSVVVRNHEVELGYFQMDPCNLAPEQAELVADIVKCVLLQGARLAADENDLHVARNGGVVAYSNWLRD
ncbi:MAG: aminotransferase class V-fold PLP-dependent enzyme [Granulosicoccus sp.]